MIPSASDPDLSTALLGKLRSIHKHGKIRIEIETDDALREALAIFAEKHASGQPLHIIEDTKEYTSTEAAEILRVSRGFLNKILKDGKLPYRKVGAHKRIEANDLFKFKAQADRKSSNAISALDDLTREFGNDE